MEVCSIHQNITASVAFYFGHAPRCVFDAVSLVIVVNEWRKRETGSKCRPVVAKLREVRNKLNKSLWFIHMLQHRDGSY